MVETFYYGDVDNEGKNSGPKPGSPRVSRSAWASSSVPVDGQVVVDGHFSLLLDTNEVNAQAHMKDR
jgi:hypothetical protein